MKFLVLFLFSFKAYTADIENGKKLFSKCVSCHGKEGLGKKSQKAPMLAGQYAWYVEAQIKAIKEGRRANTNAKKMVTYVKNLSDSQISDLAAYISSLPKIQ